MNKKGIGFIEGIVGLLGGMVFIWLLFMLWGSGAMFGIAGSKGIIMLAIFLGVLWIITRGKK